MNANVDSYHAVDCIKRCSKTGFIIFLNNSSIYWFTKKQGGIETSIFGSEFIAMKQCCEYIQDFMDTLRMMGIPVDGPSYIFGDNKSIPINSSKPTSALKKRATVLHNFVRE